MAAPNGQITFSPIASCTSTTYDSGTNTWEATVPIRGDNEIFLACLAFPFLYPEACRVESVRWTGRDPSVFRQVARACRSSGNGARLSAPSSQPITTLSASKPGTKRRVDRATETTQGRRKARTAAMCPGRTTLLVVRGAAAARTGRVRGAARIRSNLVVHHNCFECFFRMLCDDDFLIYCAVSIRAGSLFRKRKAALRVVDLVVCPMLYASVSVSATQLSS